MSAGDGTPDPARPGPQTDRMATPGPLATEDLSAEAEAAVQRAYEAPGMPTPIVQEQRYV